MFKIIKKYNNYIFFFVLLFFLILLKFANLNFIKSVSFLGFDLYQKVFPLKNVDSQVIIVDIDEKSLGKFGQFPWSRSVFAKIIENVNSSNPKAIGFDVFFTEQDKQSPEQIIKSYELKGESLLEFKKIKGHDEVFKEQLKNSKSVIAVLGSNVPSHGRYNRKSKARFLSKGGNPKKSTYSFPHSIGSLEMLEKNSRGLGSISFLDQTDGIIRSIPLIVQLDKNLFPTMGLEMIRVGENKKNIFVEMDEIGINKINIKPYKINTDPNGIIWIRYKKHLKSQYISASSVFDGNFDKERFNNKYVLIGASAQGLFDLVKTPLGGSTIPGVEVHANVIENILNNNFLMRNPKTFIFELLVSIIIVSIVFFLSQKLKPKISLIIFFGSILLFIFFGFTVYLIKSNLIDISYPLFMLTVTFLTGLYFRFVEENKMAIENLKKEAKLLKERELAGGVQKSLFPDISKFENFIYALNIPARDVSGDYFDVIKVNKDEYYFTLADVSGKGVKAGMYMAKASSIFRTLTNLPFLLKR